MFIARQVVRLTLAVLLVSALVLVSAVYLARATPTRTIMVTEPLSTRSRDPYNSVYLVDLGRCERVRLPLITLQDTLAWSPTGDHIAFLSRSLGGLEIYMSDWRGINMRKVSDNFTQDTHLTFSPNGTALAFSVESADQYDVAVIDLTRVGGLDTVVNVSDESVSPASAERILTPPMSVEVSPAWSPDGSYLVYSAAGGQADVIAAPSIETASYGHFELFMMNLRTQQVTQLTSGERWSFSPTWSPDGSQIAYVSFNFESQDNQQSHYAISVIDVALDVDTGEIRVSAPRDLFEIHGTVLLEPAFTPDGEEIAFVADKTAGQQIQIMSANGANHRDLPCMNSNIRAFAFRP